MAGKVRTWVWVVVAVIVVGILGIIAIAGVSIFFFSRHIETETASATSTAREVEAIKARFADSKPLIELDSRGNFVRSNAVERAAAPSGRSPDSLHVLAFDPDDERVVRLSIPFWLLRLKSRAANIDLNGRKINLEELKLTVDDLERYGPSLLIEHTDDDGSHVLVWTQ